jgi:hypothetical protein
VKGAWEWRTRVGGARAAWTGITGWLLTPGLRTRASDEDKRHTCVSVLFLPPFHRSRTRVLPSDITGMAAVVDDREM